MNKEEAVRLYALAVDQGYARAQNNLGYCYQEGIGVCRDAEEAIRLYRRAADQGYARAHSNLAYCYAKGIGVKRDNAKAIAMYKAAADLREQAEEKKSLSHIIEDIVNDKEMELSF